ncbi:MAG: FliH/SctL family protein [Clostridium sp.]
MQSSYNLIKSEAATAGNDKIISTKYRNGDFVNEDYYEEENNLGSSVNSIMQSYENIGSGIVKNAKKEAEQIILKSLEQSAIDERKAYDIGYSKGSENGYEDGYKKATEDVERDTEAKVKANIEKSEEILASASFYYENYMDEKKGEIINLAMQMAKVIAGKELELTEGILHLIDPILEKAKGEANIVIKCNSIHTEAVRERLDFWQKAYAIKGEIFLLEDSLMKPGNAQVQKKTGKTIVGIDIALEKLQELILN